MVGPCCHGDVVGMETEVAGWGQAAGCSPEINCDCDSGERRIKQQAIRG